MVAGVGHRNHPVDRGWSWVICFAAMINSGLTVGLLKANGIIFVSVIEYFNSSSSLTSTILSIVSIAFSITSALVMYVIADHVTLRKIIIIGGLVLSTGLFLSAFAPNVPFLIFTSGLMFGCGCGAVFGPSAVMVGIYFDNRRGVANSIAISGTSLGQLAFAPLVRFLIDKYSILGAYMVIAGITCHSIVCGCLMRPPSYYCKKSCDVRDLDEIVHETNILSENEAVINDERIHENGFHYASNQNGIHSNINISEQQQDQLKPLVTLYRRIQSNDAVQYCSTGDMFCASLTDVTITESYEEKEYKGLNLRKWIDVSIFKNGRFCLLLLGGALIVMGTGPQSVYIAAYATDMGIPDPDVAIIITIIGSCDLFSRLVIGVILDWDYFPKRFIIGILVGINGVACLFASFYHQMWSLSIYSVIFGLFGGAYISTVNIYVIEVAGLQMLSKCLGMVMMCNGLSTAIVYPIYGWIRDYTGSYLLCIYIMGGFALVGAGVLLLEPCVQKHENSSRDDVETNIAERKMPEDGDENSI